MKKKFWIQSPPSCNASIAPAVYNHINKLTSTTDVQKGWQDIWRLPVLPRVKIFIQKLAHGQLPTGDYLYQLNIGTIFSCYFYGLIEDTAQHLLWKCPKIQSCWQELCCIVGLLNIDLNYLSFGAWFVERSLPPDAKSLNKALIATVAWLIWKHRCDLIFRNLPVNVKTTVNRAWSQCKDLIKFSNNTCRECPKLTRNASLISIYTDASWSSKTSSFGLNFIIITNFSTILIVGAEGATFNTPIMAELTAIDLALKVCASRG